MSPAKCSFLQMKVFTKQCNSHGHYLQATCSQVAWCFRQLALLQEQLQMQSCYGNVNTCADLVLVSAPLALFHHGMHLSLVQSLVCQ